MPQGSINPLSEAEPAINQSGVLTARGNVDTEAEGEKFIGNLNFRIRCEGNPYPYGYRICNIEGTNESDAFHVGGGDYGALYILSMRGGGVVKESYDFLKLYGLRGDDNIAVLIHGPIDFPNRTSVSLAVHGGEGKDRITVGADFPGETSINLFGGSEKDIFVLKQLKKYDWPYQKGAYGLDYPPFTTYSLLDFNATAGEKIDVSDFTGLSGFEGFVHLSGMLYMPPDFRTAIRGPVNKAFSPNDFIFYRPNLPEAN